MSNTALATCLAGCLFVLEQLNVSPIYAAFAAVLIGFGLGKIITREVRHERGRR